MLEELPNVFVIGAAKAGTTTLCDSLRSHPQAYVPSEKEPNFFADDRNFERGLAWYAHRFYRHAGRFAVRVDGSTQCLFWGKKVAPRIQDACGDANPRFLALFRDPVQRAYAWYWLRVAAGAEKLTFEEALRAESERFTHKGAALEARGGQAFGYFRGGCYATNLRPFLEAFPRECFRFILFDDLLGDFQGTMDGALSFLNLQPRPMRKIRSNPSAQPVSQRLVTFIKKPTGVPGALLRLLFRGQSQEARWRTKIRALTAIRRPVAYPLMPEHVERELRSRFAGEIQDLSTMISRDLSTWLPR